MKTSNILSSVSAFIIILLSVQSSSGADVSRDSLNMALFGKVYIYNRTTTPKNVILMISGDAGWNSGVIGFSQTFSEMNALVIGVNILEYFKDLRQSTVECYNVAADFAQLAAAVEKKYDFPDYMPVIMGYSS